MKIGYQGIQGSNSERATKEFIKKNNLKAVELIPLVNSEQVAKYIVENKIKYGVMAIKNSIAGNVKETETVLKKYNLNIISKEQIYIHHYLYKKKSVLKENIKIIASHEQALYQTKHNISKMFGNIKNLPLEDTALSAKLLYENFLEDHIAVICSKEAGELYKLDCIASNIEDDKNNITEFILVSK